MAMAKIYNQEKNVVGEMDLTDDIFSVEVKPEILHFVVRAFRNARRAGTVGVKNRALIRGGGKKPWRQKGTGRARAGSVRSPLWKGGAVVHGPQARDYSFKVNKKIRRLALKMALTSRFVQDDMLIVDKLDLNEIKTKAFVGLRERLGLKKVLIVVPEEYKNLTLSARNVPGVQVTTQDALNVYDILRHPQLVMEQGAVEKLQERLQ
ncbi:50S ribosomal protein L4 [Desulfoplanes formicivorans]|uniref:Large ribosomal subunit protein uL4 n=1 Tax=Desulfoplanes formicivorans TaxID=1592317 RepID=A0A194ABK6_9BACT|nr:50S ribosomal protein L4 [Desulfoplanes formicivorans]GAU07542.1 50S ribosomal protein L4 [Desulfoplanes formicivorans]